MLSYLFISELPDTALGSHITAAIKKLDLPMRVTAKVLSDYDEICEVQQKMKDR